MAREPEGPSPAALPNRFASVAYAHWPARERNRDRCQSPQAQVVCTFATSVATSAADGMADNNHHDRADVWSAVLLAAATVASAWCAYQAALWGGDQLRQLATANAAHFKSLRDDNVASASRLIDVGTFLNVIESDTRGDHQIASYIIEHARPEFRATLEDWFERRRAGHEPVELPFAQPSYRLAAEERAEVSLREANAAIKAANEANGHGDLFVLHTVLFASALFFLGSASSASRRFLRKSMLVLGTAVFVLTVLSMIRLPRAPTAPRPSDLRAARHESG
jgi:hypothetical protein